MDNFNYKTIDYGAISALEVSPAMQASASVIWLHGLGADGNDFAPAIPNLQLPTQSTVRFIFPHAPVRPVTLNGGMVMPAWYDLYGLSFGTREDAPGLQQAAAWIHNIVLQENALGIPTHRIVIGGFSQGGAVALQFALRYPEQLAGVLALSTYLPLASSLAAEAALANQSTPIFWGHGQVDSLVPLTWAEHAKTHLNALGYHIDFKTYPIAHTVNAQELMEIGQWLVKVLM